MARSNKSSQQAVSTKSAKATKSAPAAKVGKLDKSAKADKATPAKAPKASGQQATRRGQYAGMRIKNVAGSDTPCRGDAAIRFDTIVSHKSVDDAIGAEYTTAAGETRKIQSVDIAYLIKRGLIEVA